MPRASCAAAADQRMNTENAGDLAQPAVSANREKTVKTKMTNVDDVTPSGSRSTADGKADGCDDCSTTDANTDFETDSASEEENGCRKPNAARIPAAETLTPEPTILFFDWDDTLLPATWSRDQSLQLHAESVPTDEQLALLGQVAASVARMLQKAPRQGEVVVGTSA